MAARGQNGCCRQAEAEKVNLGGVLALHHHCMCFPEMGRLLETLNNSSPDCVRSERARQCFSGCFLVVICDQSKSRYQLFSSYFVSPAMLLFTYFRQDFFFICCKEKHKLSIVPKKEGVTSLSGIDSSHHPSQSLRVICKGWKIVFEAM